MESQPQNPEFRNNPDFFFFTCFCSSSHFCFISLALVSNLDFCNDINSNLYKVPTEIQKHNSMIFPSTM